MRPTLRGRGLKFSGVVAILLPMATGGCAMFERPKASPPPPRILGQTQARKPGKKEIDPTRVRTRDDIVEIYQPWPQTPWLYDEFGRVVGFRVRTYFISGTTQKGAFVPGTIVIKLSEVHRLPGGRYQRIALHTWEFSERDALGYRIRRLALTGYSYGFVLRWPQELDLAGKTIEIAFYYRRLNGSVVRGLPRRFRVPVSGERPVRTAPTTEPG